MDILFLEMIPIDLAVWLWKGKFTGKLIRFVSYSMSVTHILMQKVKKKKKKKKTKKKKNGAVPYQADCFAVT